MDRKSWLIPEEILKEYLETHKELFKTQIDEGKKNDHEKK
jgi:hypothetical protein